MTDTNETLEFETADCKLTQEDVSANQDKLHKDPATRKMLEHWWNFTFGKGKELDATGTGREKHIKSMLETINSKESDKVILTDFIKEKGL